jgi:xylulokinase
VSKKVLSVAARRCCLSSKNGVPVRITEFASLKNRALESKDTVSHELLLGIDLGTTLTKVGIFTPDGTVVRLQTAPTPITWDGPEEAHHDPDALWVVVIKLLQDVTHDLEPKRLVSLGVSSFGEAGVLLDADGTATTPVLAWFDSRPKGQFDALATTLDLHALRRQTGLMADHTYSLFKLLWFKDQIKLDGLRWVSVADWIAFKLTGAVQMGVTHASRTLLFDLKHQTWLEDTLRDLGLPPDILAPIRRPTELIGRITKEAANLTGLPHGLPVMESVHDQPSAAAGVGATEPGVLLNSCGTAEILLATLESDRLESALQTESVVVGHHALPDRYYVMTSMRASGSVFDWFVRMAGSLESQVTSGITPERYDQVIRAAADVSMGADGVNFVPHLRQLSDDPKNPSLPGGVFLGLRESHGLGHLARAVLEGLALESERMLKRIEGAVGPVGSSALIRAVGGPAQNALWMQLKADLYGLPFEVYAAPNAATWGAAWLAWHHLNANRGTPIPSSLEPKPEIVYTPTLPSKQAVTMKTAYSSRVTQLALVLETEPMI